MSNKIEASATALNTHAAKSKTLVWLWAAIVGVGLVLWLLDSLNRLPFGSLALHIWAMASFGIFLTAQLVTGNLLSNQMRPTLSKHEMPFQYWTIVLLECFLALGLVFVALNEIALFGR